MGASRTGRDVGQVGQVRQVGGVSYGLGESSMFF